MVRVAESLKRELEEAVSSAFRGEFRGYAQCRQAKAISLARIIFLRALQYPVAEIDLHSTQAYDTWA